MEKAPSLAEFTRKQGSIKVHNKNESQRRVKMYSELGKKYLPKGDADTEHTYLKGVRRSGKG